MSRKGDKWNRAKILGNWWNNVAKGDFCWIWIGPQNVKGYGRCTRTLTGERAAHRSSYVLHKGPIPEGLVIDHTCDVRLCVNPDHLEAVTQAENNSRISERGRTGNGKKTHCPRGHEYDIHKNGKRHCSICIKIRNDARPRKTEVRD